MDVDVEAGCIEDSAGKGLGTVCLCFLSVDTCKQVSCLHVQVSFAKTLISVFANAGDSAVCKVGCR
jgi:hypothetical protein